jgi:hypothetical protein
MLLRVVKSVTVLGGVFMTTRNLSLDKFVVREYMRMKSCPSRKWVSEKGVERSNSIRLHYVHSRGFFRSNLRLDLFRTDESGILASYRNIRKTFGGFRKDMIAHFRGKV